jgi:hypothetical protein
VLVKLKAISKRMGQALGRIEWYPKHHLRYYNNELGKDYECQTPTTEFSFLSPLFTPNAELPFEPHMLM